MATISPDLSIVGAHPPDMEAEIDPRTVPALSVQAVYAEHVEQVWRSLRGLGVPRPSLDDAVQDVFLVVHRRLDEFEGRASLRTWLFAIVLASRGTTGARTGA